MGSSSQTEQGVLGAVIALLLFTFVAWSGIKASAIDLALQREGVRTSGEIIEADEDFDEIWHHYAVYEFRTMGGSLVTGVAKGDGRLRSDLRNLKGRVPVVVEYLPSSPEINQLRLKLDKPVGVSIGFRHVLAAAIVFAWVALAFFAAARTYRWLRAKRSGLAA